MITIFTPVYNRADIIGRLYQSLLNQTNHDFEWLIVDDGSKDHVDKIIYQWLEEKKAPFDIRFYRQENGGKHRAINRGVQLARGDAFFIVDSDDYLTDDAVELIQTWWENVKDDEAYAGVSGLKANEEREIIGGKPSFETYIDATNMERAEYGLLADKAEVYKTSVLRRYPFPEFAGENFLTEAVVWDKIAYDGLKIRWFNQIIYICEYREDGLSFQGINISKKNPAGWGAYIKQTCSFYQYSEHKKLDWYLLYYLGLKDVLREEEIQNNLGIENEIFEEIKERHRTYMQKTIQEFGNKIALYGMGRRAKRIIDLYRDTEIKILFVMDQKKMSVPYPYVSLEEECPSVDVMIVTPKGRQKEIIRFLEKKTANRLIEYDEWRSCVGLSDIF